MAPPDAPVAPVADALAQAVAAAQAAGNAEVIETAAGHTLLLFCRGNLEEAKAALRADIVRRAAQQADKATAAGPPVPTAALAPDATVRPQHHPTPDSGS